MPKEFIEIQKAVHHNVWFWTLTGIAIAMLCVSMILPPTGEIHPSVIKGVGWVFAFAALGTLIKAMDMGVNATVRKGDASLTVGDIPPAVEDDALEDEYEDDDI